MRAIGAPPSSVRNGRPVYTLPVVVDLLRSPTSPPAVLSNPNTIADYLEAAYPARPIFPEGSRAVQALFVHYVQEVFTKPLLPILVPLSHQHLPERSRTHFRSDSPGIGGGGTVIGTGGGVVGGASGSGGVVGLPPGPQREQAWVAVKEQFDFLAGIMDKNGVDGNGNGMVLWVQGGGVSYADFALCAVLIWIERVAPHDGWQRIRQWNGGRWTRLCDACREWMDVL
jgi:glutathione S-transferase